MQARRFENILALRRANGDVVGFHAQNLAIARLDEKIWQALADISQAPADVVAELREWNQEQDNSVNDAHLEQKVRSLTINVSQVCNLKCTYCAAGGDGSYGSRVIEIDTEKVQKQLQWLLRDVKEGEGFAIRFIGGEPLVYPEAMESIARMARLMTVGRDIRLHFSMVTNATLMTEDIAQMLIRLKMAVTVSLDGSPEINDRVRVTRGGQGSSSRVMKGLALLLKYQSQLGGLEVNSVFGAHNTDVYSSYMYLREFPWDKMRFSYAVGPDDEIHSPRFVESLLKAADRAFADGGERELRRIGDFNHFFEQFDNPVRVYNFCSAGKSGLHLDTEGKFYACHWFTNQKEEELGNDLHLRPERLADYKDPLLEKHDCGSCWARFVCGGGCMFIHRERTGNKHKKDAEFCNRTRATIAKGVELYEQARN